MAEGDADEDLLTTRAIKVLRGSLSRYHFRLLSGELCSHVPSLIEQYGYH